MAIVSMKSLLESGVHFGHRTHKWHPRMKTFIFTERNGIHIIDLQQTVTSLEVAYNLIRDTVAEGGTILFVGTKRQAQETIRDEAVRAGMPYVVNRWLGGMLTNWRTIRQRVNELETLERMRERGDFERITKKEALNMERRIERLDFMLGGIRNMNQLPDLVFVVDVRREETAVHEANLLEIPIVAMVDTNCDPKTVDYVVPSNDDAIRAIKLIVSRIADAAVEGRNLRKDLEEELEPAGVMVMEGIEEQELTDEELLGEATLAKITASQEAAEREQETEEAEEMEQDLDIEVEEDAVEPGTGDEGITDTVEETVMEEEEMPELDQAPIPDDALESGEESQLPEPKDEVSGERVGDEDAEPTAVEDEEEPEIVEIEDKEKEIEENDASAGQEEIDSGDEG